MLAYSAGILLDDALAVAGRAKIFGLAPSKPCAAAVAFVPPSLNLAAATLFGYRETTSKTPVPDTAFDLAGIGVSKLVAALVDVAVVDEAVSVSTVVFSYGLWRR